MYERKFFGIVSLVCLLPAFVGGLITVNVALGAEVNTRTQVIMIVGVIALLFYIIAAAMVFTNERSWWNEERYHKVRDAYINHTNAAKEAEDLFNGSSVKLAQMLMREDNNDDFYWSGYTDGFGSSIDLSVEYYKNKKKDEQV